MSHTARSYEVTVAEAITQCLRREGVDHVFGIPGSMFLVLLDAFHRGGMKSIESRHENSAAFMAAGYTMAKGGIGVMHTTCGPGTTNILTGVSAAYMDSVPLLLFASQASRHWHGTGFHQETTGFVHGVDQLDIFRTVSHYRARPPVPDVAVPMLRNALRAALGRRGPACYELTFDLSLARVTHQDLLPSAYRSPSTPVDAAGVESLCRLLRDAKAPALVVGNGLSHMGMSGELTAFCEEQQIPCSSINYVKGLIAEDHPLSLGVCGETGGGAAKEYLGGADLVVLLGVRTSTIHTGWFTADMSERLVQVDDSVDEIARNRPVQLGIVGHVPATLRALRVAMQGTNCPRSLSGRVAELRAKHREYDHPDGLVDNERMTAARWFRIMREELPRETLVAGDCGSNLADLSRHFAVYAPDGLYSLQSLGSMASSLPLAIGVQLARPEALVVNVIGDGSFLMCEGELSVAVQHQLPIITVVINNGLFKNVTDRQLAWFERTYATALPAVRYADIGKAHGCDGYLVHDAAEARQALRGAVKARRPAVIEVIVDGSYGDTVAKQTPVARRYLPSIPQGWPFPAV